MKHSILYSTIVLLGMISSVTTVFTGNGGVKGGDPVALRKSDMRELLESKSNGMKRKIRTFVALTKSTSLTVDAQRAYVDMVARDLIGDLESRYDIIDSIEGTGECLKDVGGKKVKAPASSQTDDFKGPICFDLGLLYAAQTTVSEMVGLAFHEHAHHFGYEDADYTIARATKKVFEKNFLHVAENTSYEMSGKKITCFGLENNESVYLELPIDLVIKSPDYPGYWGPKWVASKSDCSLSEMGPPKLGLLRFTNPKMDLPSQGRPGIWELSCYSRTKESHAILAWAKPAKSNPHNIVESYAPTVTGYLQFDESCIDRAADALLTKK